jgi:hypothetical protein
MSETADISILSFSSVVVYSNADTEKESIVKENKNKSGVYR